jgi:hypothetical protein
MQHWEKKGQIYEVENKNPYLISHASNPLAVHLEKNVFRVFFSARDINNKSSVSSVDIDVVTHKVINVSDEMLLAKLLIEMEKNHQFICFNFNRYIRIIHR